MAKRARAAKAQAPEQQPSDLIELGLPSLKIRSGRIEEEWRERLRGKKKFKVFREMGDADVTAGGFLNTLQNFLLKVEWTVKPREVDGVASPEAERVAKRVQGAWEDMEETPSNILAEVLLHAARDGSAPMERTYKICRGDSEDPLFNSDFDDGMLAWRSMSIRPLESVDRWEYDSKANKITGMVQLTEPDYRMRKIPIEKLLIFKFRGAKGSPEGVSMLSIGERAYYFKKLLEELEAIGAKRDLAGLPVARVPVSVAFPGANAAAAATFEEIKNAVQLIDRDELEGLVFPTSEDKNGKTGYDFGLMASSGTRQFDLDKVIRRLRGEMSIGFGAGFMFAGHDGVGARSLDESKQDAFKLAAYSVLASIKQTLDVAVVDMMRLNKIPRALWPHFEHGEIDPISVAEFTAAVNSGFQSGALSHDDELESEYRAKAGIKPRKTLAAVPLLAPADMPADPVAGPVAAPEEPAANTALNGAQVTAAQAIVASLNAGELAREQAIAMLVNFFNLPRASAEEMAGPEPDPATKDEQDFSKDSLRDTMTMQEVQRVLQRGKTGVLQLVESGQLRGTQVGDRWRFDPKSVHELLAGPAAKRREVSYDVVERVVERVAKRLIPREAGIAQLVSIAGCDKDTAEAVMGEAGRSWVVA